MVKTAQAGDLLHSLIIKKISPYMSRWMEMDQTRVNKEPR